MIEIEELDKNNQQEVEQILEMIASHLGGHRSQHAETSLQQGSAEFVVAKIEGKIVACASYGFSQFHYETWWLGFCVVLPEYRRLHISSILVDRRLEKIKQAGGRWVLAASLEPVDRVIKRGFVKLCETDPHQLMIIDLSKDKTGSLGDKEEPEKDLI